VSLKYSDADLKWPRIGLIRSVSADAVHEGALTEDEVEYGLDGTATFVPFEKGDDSAEGGGAKWRRDNPLVIDWSHDCVTLLRERAQRGGSRSPRLQNERVWGKGGVTWNSLARYLRSRLVPEGAIFGHMTPTIRPTVDWLTTFALLALLNSRTLDYTTRTFLGSLMHIEIGDVRRLPVPVLNDDQAERLDALGRGAVAAKEAQDCGQPSDLVEIERELDAYVRALYGVRRNADLWVVR
jgi:hypothetical protein